MRDSMEQADDKGLCINCDDRLICTLHKPGQQILFCEEYQLPLREDERESNQQENFSALIDFGNI